MTGMSNLIDKRYGKLYVFNSLFSDKKVVFAIGESQCVLSRDECKALYKSLKKFSKK